MKIKPLNPEDLSLLRSSLLDAYLLSNCFPFAIALHRGLNWSIIGIREVGSTVIYHAGVVTPKKTFFDARGETDKLNDFTLPFDDYTNKGFEMIEVNEKDLIGTKPINNDFIETTSIMIQTAWPELPWNNNTLQHRIRLYAEELEALSQKHNLWIRESFVTTRPIFGDSDYVLQPTLDCFGYSLKRELV